jgi:hypothetical protein
MIEDESVALTLTGVLAVTGGEPEVVVTVLPVIVASVSVVIVLPDPEPAPAKDTPPPLPPLTLPATPIVIASIVAVSVAVSESPPGVVNVGTVSTVALTELLIVLIATAAPTVTFPPLEPL